MKTFMLDFTKEREYSQTPTDLYRKRFTYIDINMRHAWKKNTFYRRGDVVFDYIETKKFFILYFEGTSSAVDTIYEDELDWIEYNAMITKPMTNFNEILLQDDIEKYRTDDKYYDIYNVPTNIKIEQIAYEQYNDVNFWDTILVLNNMKTYLELPRSNDIIISKTLEKLKKWGTYFGYSDEDFLYLENYLDNIKIDRSTDETKGTWGRYKEIRTSFQNQNSSGAYYLTKGDLVQVRDFHGRKNVLFHYKKQQPKTIICTFPQMDTETPSNPIYPMEINDVVSLDINNVTLTHNVSGIAPNDSQFLQGTYPFSLLSHLDSMLTAADIYGINFSVDYTVNNESITFQNDPSILSDYNVLINPISFRQVPSTGLQGKSSDVININTRTDITIQECVDLGYFEEVEDTFILIDYNDEEELARYNLLLEMYNKYFDEMNELNNKFQFLKVLKPEYLNEFKEAFQKKRKIVKGIE